jgi:hypothetical protein
MYEIGKKSSIISNKLCNRIDYEKSKKQIRAITIIAVYIPSYYYQKSIWINNKKALNLEKKSALCKTEFLKGLIS